MNAIEGEQFGKQLKIVCNVFEGDVTENGLWIPLLSRLITENRLNIKDLIAILQKLTPSQKQLLPEVVTLAKLMLVILATNAISERSFSSLNSKRIKTYMRATTSDNRLNHMMALHIHKEKVDSIDLVDVGNVFVEREESKKLLRIFGRFKYCDISRKRKYASVGSQT